MEFATAGGWPNDDGRVKAQPHSRTSKPFYAGCAHVVVMSDAATHQRSRDVYGGEYASSDRIDNRADRRVGFASRGQEARKVPWYGFAKRAQAE